MSACVCACVHVRVLTLGERLPVVEATHELLSVKGGALLGPGLRRASTAHLWDRRGVDGEGQGGLDLAKPRYIRKSPDSRETSGPLEGAGWSRQFALQKSKSKECLCREGR